VGGFAEYGNYDALGLAALVKRREVTPAELLDAALSRAAVRDPLINAITIPMEEFARKAISEGVPGGPFEGVPFLLKDLTASVTGVRMTRTSRFFADTPPATADSEHVKRLKRAGLVFFGRTNTCEMGLGLTCEPQLTGPTKNPWDLTRISGGSSGGAAAATAARIVPMAHGTDGFGSIRAPAACCGLVGLKPTRGRNTLAPFAGEALAGLAAEHGVTLTVRDCAALLDATSGPGDGDPYAAAPPAGPFLQEVGADPGRLRIAFTRKAPNGAAVGEESLRELDAIAKLCAELGHHVEEADPAVDGDAMVPTFLTLIAAATVVNLGGHPNKNAPEPGEIENVTRALYERGLLVSGPDYLKAVNTSHRLGRQSAAFFANHDVLLTPGLGGPAARLGWIDMMLEDADEYWRRVFEFSPFTVWFNLTGQPALMLPLGMSGEGLPLGTQFVARFGDEATLFRLAAQLEAARPWFGRKPALVTSTPI